MTAWTALSALLGGIGLFLLGMWLMTDGLKRVAGGALRQILANWTRTTARGILAGTALTALVQSSSAVTVAAVGFVNAGLLSLKQVVGVIYGSNIGTTVTGWIVALTGVQVKLDAYALPLVGLGMLLRISGPTTLRGAYGQALAGFALFLLGVQALKMNFAGLAGQVDFAALPVEGWRATILYFGIGVGLTILIQSSSATTAITIAAAAAGIVPVPLAALVVIGADIGTSSSAAFAAIGATANARRAAACHVLFNLATATFALVALYPLLELSAGLQEFLGLPAGPAVELAVFSTVFNVLGVLLMLPFTGAMARFLERRFASPEEGLARPQHLDENLLEVPALAVHGITLEVQRLGSLSLRLAADSCERTAQSMPGLVRTDAALNNLTDRIRTFVARLDLSVLPPELARPMAPLLRAVQHYEELSDLAIGGAIPEQALPEPLAAEWQGLIEAARQALLATDTTAANHRAPAMEEAVRAADARYESLKASLLLATAEGRLPLPDLDRCVQEAGRLHRMIERAAKAARRIGASALSPAPEGAPQAG